MGRSRGGGGQEEMEEASQEESHYILAICVISWLSVLYPGCLWMENVKKNGTQVETGDGTTKSYHSLNLLQSVCLLFPQQHHLNHPYSPLPNQYPYALSRGLDSFVTTKTEAINGNSLNSLDPTY